VELAVVHEEVIITLVPDDRPAEFASLLESSPPAAIADEIVRLVSSRWRRNFGVFSVRGQRHLKCNHEEHGQKHLGQKNDAAGADVFAVLLHLFALHFFAIEIASRATRRGQIGRDRSGIAR